MNEEKIITPYALAKEFYKKLSSLEKSKLKNNINYINKENLQKLGFSNLQSEDFINCLKSIFDKGGKDE